MEFESLSRIKEKRAMIRNWMYWFGLVAATFFYTWFYGGFLSFTMMYVVLLLPVVSLAALIGNLFSFKISENLNGRIFVKGESAKYELILGNESALTIPYITISMYLEGQVLCSDMKSMQFSMSPFSKKLFIYEMPLNYRGRYSIGVRKIIFRDFLGLFSISHKPLEQKTILVKPRINFMKQKLIPAAMVSEGNVLAGLFESGNDEMVDIRKYVPGDNLRKMHWKLTAKTGNAMVRDMRNELDNDIIMILDIGMPKVQNITALSEEDCLIEETVMQAEYLLTRGMPVRLCLWRDEPVILRATTPGDFLKVYDLLSEVKFNQVTGFEDTMENFLDAGTHRSLVYLFSVNLTNKTIENGITMRHRGFDIELYYINEPSSADKQRKSSSFFQDQMAKNGIRTKRLTPDVLSDNKSGFTESLDFTTRIIDDSIVSTRKSEYE